MSNEKQTIEGIITKLEERKVQLATNRVLLEIGVRTLERINVRGQLGKKEGDNLMSGKADIRKINREYEETNKIIEELKAGRLEAYLKDDK